MKQQNLKKKNKTKQNATNIQNKFQHLSIAINFDGKLVNMTVYETKKMNDVEMERNEKDRRMRAQYVRYEKHSTTCVRHTMSRSD